MEDNNKIEPSIDKKATDEEHVFLKDNFFSFIKSLFSFLKNTLSFAEDVDAENSINQIKKDIDFRGFNVWILFFSIIIASIGLNVDSIAVIIGAMLISPLMGPIMGIGLSIGTNDYKTLIRSIKSFGIAVTVSLVASTLYFFVSPFDEAGHQLLSRTQPLLFDVFIAIFGGFAGIMAVSRNKVSNVIPGVAISTALMPPLCTAGYGLAHLNFQFFTGAIYLFIINSVYISLATFVVVRYLKFPIVNFLDPLREKKIKRYITIFAIVLVFPSVYTLYTSYQENRFMANVKEFVGKNFEKDYTNIVTDYQPDSISVVYIHATKNTNNLSEGYLNKQLGDYSLRNTRIILTDENEKFAKLEKELQQMKFGDIPVNSNDMIKEYKNSMEMLRMKDMEIMALLNQVQSIQGDSIPFNNIVKEVKVNYPNVRNFAFGKVKQNNMKSTVELPTFMVSWNYKKNESIEKEKLQQWLKVRLNLDTLQVITY